MKLTVTCTNRVVTVNGAEGRVWQGESDTGLHVYCVVSLLAVDDPGDEQKLADFEREMVEQIASAPAPDDGCAEALPHDRIATRPRAAGEPIAVETGIPVGDFLGYLEAAQQVLDLVRATGVKPMAAALAGVAFIRSMCVGPGATPDWWVDLIRATETNPFASLVRDMKARATKRGDGQPDN